VRASYHEELCSDGVMAPPGVGSVVGSDLGVVLDRGIPPGAAGDVSLDAETHTLWAKHTADGGVLYVPQALNMSPSAPRINAQRVA
jgi:hypothetical protein